MVRKFGSHNFLSLTGSLLLALLIIYFFFTPKASSREMKLTQDLAQHFVQHQRLTLDVAATAAQVRQTGRMSLAASDLKFDLDLVPHDIRAADYRAEEFGADGVGRRIDPGPVRTFKGVARGTEHGVRLGQLGQARFTVDERGVEGMIITPAEHYFVEPARKYSKEANVADYVIYKESDVLTSSTGDCGVTLSETVAQKAAEFRPPSQPVAPAEPKPANKEDQFKRSSLPANQKIHRHHTRITRNAVTSFPDCATVVLPFNSTVTGNLQGNCVSDGRWFDIYTFSGSAGQEISLATSSGVFNTYLYLL